MFRYFKAILIFVVLSFVSIQAAQQSNDELYRKAQEFEQKGYYDKACKFYQKAWDEYIKKGNLSRADICRVSMHQLEKIMMEYPYTKEEVFKLLEENFPDLSAHDRREWVENNVLSRNIDGKEYYYENFIENLKFRNIKLMHNDERFYLPMEKFFNKYQDVVFKESNVGYSTPSWKTTVNPTTFFVDAKLKLPRRELPDEGILQLWLPIPIKTTAQDGIRIISITPEEYISVPVSVDRDIGLVYMEIPLQ